MKKETRISIRASEDLKERLKNASKITGINETNLVISCVEALIDYIETNGEITMPLVVLPKKSLTAATPKQIRKTA